MHPPSLPSPTSDPADKKGVEDEEWHPLPEGQAYNQPSHSPTTCLLHAWGDGDGDGDGDGGRGDGGGHGRLGKVRHG